MTRDDVEIQEKKRLYKGFFEMSLYKFRHRPNGSGGGFEVIKSRYLYDGDAIVVQAKFAANVIANFGLYGIGR